MNEETNLENLFFDKSYFNFKFISKYDVSEIKKYIKKIDQHQWDLYDYRQKSFDPHKNTKTIPVIDSKVLTEPPKIYESFFILEKNINEIMDILCDFYQSKLFLNKALLINLPSKKSIDYHIDSAEYFYKNMRIHIPIFTNKECIFVVGEYAINMGEGEIWEISNTEFDHAVYNNGDTDRIHLLIDVSLSDMKM